MGAGFWITQLVLVVAAIGIAISAERQNRREDDQGLDAPVVRVPLPTRRTPFTLVEQARLRLLRESVERSKAYRAELYDDLAADEPREHRAQHPWPWLRVLVCTGAVLLAVGALGMWRTELAMRALDRTAPVPRSLVTHLVPGVIVDPGRYLAAVNSGPSASAGAARDPLQALAMRDARQAMDRYEAVVGLGLALILITTDALPLLLLGSATCAALSFFELP